MAKIVLRPSGIMGKRLTKTVYDSLLAQAKGKGVDTNQESVVQLLEEEARLVVDLYRNFSLHPKTYLEVLHQNPSTFEGRSQRLTSTARLLHFISSPQSLKSIEGIKLERRENPVSSLILDMMDEVRKESKVSFELNSAIKGVSSKRDIRTQGKILQINPNHLLKRPWQITIVELVLSYSIHIHQIKHLEKIRTFARGELAPLLNVKDPELVSLDDVNFFISYLFTSKQIEYQYESMEILLTRLREIHPALFDKDISHKLITGVSWKGKEAARKHTVSEIERRGGPKGILSLKQMESIARDYASLSLTDLYDQAGTPYPYAQRFQALRVD